MGILFDVNEIFKIAIKIEENGEKFYRNTAEKIENEKLKRLFNELADEELSHKKTFEEISEKTDDYISFENYEGEYTEYLKAYTEKLIFDQKKIEKEMENVKNVLSALDFAINRELDSILYYQEIKKMVVENKHHFVEKIIQEERKHFLKLKDLREALED